MSEVVKFDHDPSDQEVFDAIVERLYNGEGQAFNNKGCVYLDEKTGKRCAVGIFIENVTPYMASCGVFFHLIDRYPNRIPEWFHTKKSLLSELQIVHDTSTWKKGLFYGEHALERIAEKFNLNFVKPRKV